MVYKDKNFIFVVFKVMLLDFKGFHNSQKLIIINFLKKYNTKYY